MGINTEDHAKKKTTNKKSSRKNSGPSTALRQIQQGNTVISYTLHRKKVKNINLTIRSDGSVAVSASPHVPEAYIDDFVRSKLSFIQKAQARIMQHQTQAQNAMPQFLSGDQIPFLGGFLTLFVSQANVHLIPGWIAQFQDGSITHFSRNNQGEALFCKNGQLYMYALDTETICYKQQLYETWQKIQAGILCRQISNQYYPHFQQLGIAYPEIKIRKMSSRWGSCIPGKKKITYNSLLLEKPVECIEYVAVHEFSHFIHPNHSKEFYGFVERILPDWKTRRELLKQ